MIHFEGDKSFPLPVADAAARLSDAAFLVRCLEDAEVTEATPDRAVWKLRPKLSFLTGNLDVAMDVAARDPGKSVEFTIRSRAIGATSTTRAWLEFREADGGGTAVHWAAAITEVTGLLKMVPKGLIQATARKVIDDVWAAVAARLTALPPSVSG
jgi:carbon monoxide dehydrogenase subunit G